MEAVLAMYIRISLEDEDLKNNGEKTESSSVSNQRELLYRFISEREELGSYEIKVFFDDGYTGRNFERPGFQKMIEECKSGTVKCIIVKDLSRLGRNYVEVGNLLEQLFPFLGVRVISVNDGYDSDSFIGQTGGIDVAFKNLVYMISRKKVYEDFESRHQIDVDRSEWIVVRNTHEGIVTQEEFDKANGNMRSVVQGKKVNHADKRNYSVIVCPYCGLRLRPGNREDSFMYCPTGRHHKESVCRQVKIKRNVAENTLVQLVRKQAEMLIQAEEMLKDRRNRQDGKPVMDMKVLKIELKKLEEGKIADYERYKAGEVSRELFIERKQASDVKKKELDSAVAELEAQSLTCDAGQNEYREVFEIKMYLHLESYDKSVMASLISSARVMGEDRLEVVWKYQDIYEKIFANIQG